MQFICPHCQQSLEIETVYGGQPTQCPNCQGELVIPDKAEQPAQGSAEQPENHTAENWRVDITEVKQALESAIDRDSMTISQYLAEHDMADGAIQIDSTDGGSASDVLTTEQGRRYKIGEVVASGGQGAILDAKDANLRRSVAMKVMLDPKQVTKAQSLRFIQEAQVTSQLQHPSIVPIYELGVDASGNIFYTMKFVAGKNLKDIVSGIKDGDKNTIAEYPLMRLLNIFQRICDAIAFAHSKRVIHRDLKPENIMVGEYGEVLVMDWGLAKVLPKKKVKKYRVKGSAADKADKADQEKQRQEAIDSVRKDVGADVLKTMDGMIMGTPRFMAPEQASGDVDKLDERTDIYALGAILYNILTLHPPITASDLNTVLKKVTSGEIPHPSEFNTGTGRRKADEEAPEQIVSLEHCPGRRIPNSLSAVTMKALVLKPTERYQSVKSLQGDIEAYQNGFATGAEEASFGKQVRLLIKRHKGITVTAGLMAMILFAAMAAYSWVNVQERKKSDSALQAFMDEQAKRKMAQVETKEAKSESAGLYIPRARKAIMCTEFNKAMAEAENAVQNDPKNPEARLLRACLRIHDKDWEGVIKDLDTLAALNIPEQPSIQTVADLDKFYLTVSSVRSLLALCKRARKKETTRTADKLAKFFVDAGFSPLAEAFVKDADNLFELYNKRLADAWPGQGIRILRALGGQTLNLCQKKGIRDFGPLRGIPLTSLRADRTEVSDLSPLKGMPLTSLNVGGTGVSDLSPLKGMSLTSLNVAHTGVSDLSPLKGMPLTSLNVTCTEVSDLSPLKGMSLTSLEVDQTMVSDLSPLKGMPLATVGLSGCRNITDLTLLKGMPLTVLSVGGTPVSDLTPLKGMPLEMLYLYACRQVSDLTPLKGMPLTSLRIDVTGVTDLTPLKGMPLKKLVIHATKVSDLTPLKGMPLISLLFTPKNITNGIEIIRHMKTIEHIGLLWNHSMPTAEFWKKYDDGEFK